MIWLAGPVLNRFNFGKVSSRNRLSCRFRLGYWANREESQPIPSILGEVSYLRLKLSPFFGPRG